MPRTKKTWTKGVPANWFKDDPLVRGSRNGEEVFLPVHDCLRGAPRDSSGRARMAATPAGRAGSHDGPGSLEEEQR